MKLSANILFILCCAKKRDDVSSPHVLSHTHENLVCAKVSSKKHLTMICPKCLNSRVALINYDPVYCIENQKEADTQEMLLDSLFHCQVKCFACQWTKWIDACITYPQPIVPLRYCYKDTTNYMSFIRNLIQQKGAYIRRELPTKEEPAICVLSYNSFWEEFRYHVDGAVYSASRDFEYVLREYEGLFPLQ